MSINVVCFDAGGVLVRICRSWEEGCAAAGVEVRRRDESDRSRHARREINAEYQRGRIADTQFFDAIAETMGVYSADEVKLVHDAWIIDEYDGVRDLVRDLHDRATVRTAVLSNTNASHWTQMGPERSMVVLDVHHPHASHLLGEVKPDEAIYRAFEQQTGFAPDEILFFDDIEDNVSSARHAGWNAHQIDHEGDTASQMRAHLLSVGLL